MTTVTKPVAAGLDVKLLHMYQQMVAIRLFEERANDLYACADARPGTPLHRRRSGGRWCLRGTPAGRLHHQHPSRSWTLPGERCRARVMFAGFFGKAGTARRADRCVADPPLATWAPMPSSEVAPASRRAAFASKYLGNQRVAVCFFGEGALGQGVLHEEMNLAQLWKLPVIYVCENNLQREYTHCSETTAGDMLARPIALE